MRVLVTGHHGYIGSVLAPIVRAAGHEVVGFDTFFYRGCDFGPTHGVGCRSTAGTCEMSPPPISTASTQSSTSPRSRTIRSAT